MNIKQERIGAIVTIVFFLVTFYLLYLTGQSTFIMAISAQLAAFSLSCLIEYVFLSMSSNEEIVKFKISPAYWILFILTLLQILNQVLQVLVGLEPVSNLLQPTFWFILWSIAIAWILGTVIIRQIFIVKYSESTS
ncbi:MAG: hypothetical protein ACFFCX_09150 [Candidatus Sifarchaeia archaeon]